MKIPYRQHKVSKCRKSTHHKVRVGLRGYLSKNNIHKQLQHNQQTYTECKT